MYPFTQFSNKKHKAVAPGSQQPEFLLHGSEPSARLESYMRSRRLGYQSRYFAKRRLMRNIRRLRSGQR